MPPLHTLSESRGVGTKVPYIMSNIVPTIRPPSPHLHHGHGAAHLLLAHLQARLDGRLQILQLVLHREDEETTSQNRPSGLELNI